MDIFSFLGRNGKILRTYRLILPKFHLILPKKSEMPRKKSRNSSLEVSKFLRRIFGSSGGDVGDLEGGSGIFYIICLGLTFLLP